MSRTWLDAQRIQGFIWRESPSPRPVVPNDLEEKKLEKSQSPGETRKAPEKGYKVGQSRHYWLFEKHGAFEGQIRGVRVLEGRFNQG